MIITMFWQSKSSESVFALNMPGSDAVRPKPHCFVGSRKSLRCGRH